MARLSVNLNKVALLRNSRRTGVPDLLHFARIALDAGAQGLTMHARPDDPHIEQPQRHTRNRGRAETGAATDGTQHRGIPRRTAAGDRP